MYRNKNKVKVKTKEREKEEQRERDMKLAQANLMKPIMTQLFHLAELAASLEQNLNMRIWIGSG